MVAMFVILMQATVTRAQLTAGGDIAGGYLRSDAKTFVDHMKHGEGRANVWLDYKAKRYDWRLTLSGSYKNVDGEKLTDDIYAAVADSATYTSTLSLSNQKPLKLSARYDFNWRQPDESSYSLWTRYDYEHTDYESTCMGTVMPIYANDRIFGRFEAKEDVCHKIAVGYRGTTQLRVPGWVLKSQADFSLSRKKVNDVWVKLQLDAGDEDDPMTWDACGWEMNPDYTDYAFNAALHLTKTMNDNGKKLVLGGGIRFSGDGEHFTHNMELPCCDFADLRVDTVFIDQHATGFRFFVEPFLSGQWQSDRWMVKAEYGLRLYHTNTTDKMGNAVRLYNFMDPQNPLSGNSFSHFTPLVAGRAQLTYNLSNHHSLTLANSISNRLPSNCESVLCFVQLRDYNKVNLGNPNLKPTVKVSFSLGHTFSNGPFSATTDISVARENNQTELYFYGCSLGGRNETVQMTRNVANVTTYKLSETLTWNSRRLKASAILWGSREHHQSVGKDFCESVVNNNNWGWRIDARANLGRGWLATANFQYTSSYKSITYEYDRVWPSAALSIEKRLGPVTIYLNANSLIDPAIRYSRYDAKGNMVYYKENRKNNRIVLLGIRWTL